MLAYWLLFAALVSWHRALADDEKVRALMDSIAEIGLQEPVRTVPAQTCVACSFCSLHEIKEQKRIARADWVLLMRVHKIDVLEVDGQYYGFSGCHRYEVRVSCSAIVRRRLLATKPPEEL